MKKINRTLLLTGLIIVIIAISIAFALFSQNLRISGSANMDPAEFGIKFTALSAPSLTGTAKVNDPAPTIKVGETEIGDYSVILKQPGDSVEYVIDVTNEGELNAEITILKVGTGTEVAEIGTSGLTYLATTQEDENIVKSGISYSLTYTDTGFPVGIGDTLDKGQTRQMTLRIAFDGDKLPSNEVTIGGLGIEIEYSMLTDASNPSITGDFAPYVAGDKVQATIGGVTTELYTVENSSAVNSEVKLIPAKSVDENLGDGFSSINYWTNVGSVANNIKNLGTVASLESTYVAEANYPLNINNIAIPEGETSVIAKANEYAKTIDSSAVGRLMTLEEAQKLTFVNIEALLNDKNLY